MSDLVDGVYQRPQFGKFFWSFRIVDGESFCFCVPVQTVELFISDLADDPAFGPAQAIPKPFLRDQVLMLPAAGNKIPVELWDLRSEKIWLLVKERSEHKGRVV